MGSTHGVFETTLLHAARTRLLCDMAAMGLVVFFDATSPVIVALRRPEAVSLHASVSKTLNIVSSELAQLNGALAGAVETYSVTLRTKALRDAIRRNATAKKSQKLRRQRIATLMSRVALNELYVTALHLQERRLAGALGDDMSAMSTGLSIYVTDANLDGYPDLYTSDWHPAMAVGAAEEANATAAALRHYANSSTISVPDRPPARGRRRVSAPATANLPQSATNVRLLLNEGRAGRPGHFVDATEWSGIRLRPAVMGANGYDEGGIGQWDMARAVAQAGLQPDAVQNKPTSPRAADATTSPLAPPLVASRVLVANSSAVSAQAAAATVGDGVVAEIDVGEIQSVGVKVLRQALHAITATDVDMSRHVGSTDVAAYEAGLALWRGFVDGVPHHEDERLFSRVEEQDGLREHTGLQHEPGWSGGGKPHQQPGEGEDDEWDWDAELEGATRRHGSAGDEGAAERPARQGIRSMALAATFPHVGSFEMASTWVDLDNDGWPDAVMSGDFGTSQLYWSNGDGTFTRGFFDLIESAEDNSMGCSIADVNGDGLPDVFFSSVHVDPRKLAGLLSNYETGGFLLLFRGNHLFINLGNRRFVDVTDTAGLRSAGWAWGASFVDVDNDGSRELFVANGMDDPETTDDEFATNEPSRLYSGTAVFESLPIASAAGADATQAVHAASRVLAQSALSSASVSAPEAASEPMIAASVPGLAASFTSALYGDHRLRVQSPVSFEDVAGAAGLDSRMDGRAAVVLDYNGDGALDLLVVNHAKPPSLFQNVGSDLGTFVRVRARRPVLHLRLAAGAPYHTVDAITTAGMLPQVVPFLHRGEMANESAAELVASGCVAVPGFLGAVVCPDSHGRTLPDPTASARVQPDGEDPSWVLVQIAASASAFAGQNEDVIHFGLGPDGSMQGNDDPAIFRLDVRFPVTNTTVIVYDVPIARTVTVVDDARRSASIEARRIGLSVQQRIASSKRSPSASEFASHEAATSALLQRLWSSEARLDQAVARHVFDDGSAESGALSWVPSCPNSRREPRAA
jgi:hypothetical protein